MSKCRFEIPIGLKPMIEFYEASQHFVRIQHVRAHTNKKEIPYTGKCDGRWVGVSCSCY